MPGEEELAQRTPRRPGQRSRLTENAPTRCAAPASRAAAAAWILLPRRHLVREDARVGESKEKVKEQVKEREAARK
jgi:hypothetical protein